MTPTETIKQFLDDFEQQLSADGSITKLFNEKFGRKTQAQILIALCQEMLWQLNNMTGYRDDFMPDGKRFKDLATETLSRAAEIVGGR